MSKINTLQLDTQERAMWKDRIVFLVLTSHKKDFSKENILRIYEEWLGVVRRIAQGQVMLEQCGGGKRNKEKERYCRSLTDLYELLLFMCGIYESFFRDTVYPENVELFERAKNKIWVTLENSPAH